LVRHVGPTLDTFPRLAHGFRRHDKGIMLVEYALAHGAGVVLERLADIGERPPGDMLLEMLDQFVERLDEDSGVTDFGKRPSSIAEASILAAVALLANYRPDQAEHRSDLLERLPHLVDDLVPRALGRQGQFLQNGVYPVPHDPPQALAEGFIGPQLCE